MDWVRQRILANWIGNKEPGSVTPEPLPESVGAPDGLTTAGEF